MLKVLERNIASIERHLVLLAPPELTVGAPFVNITTDASRYQQRLSELQMLRGNVYLEDGAVHPDQLASDGAHRTPEDDRAWHLLMLNRNGQVSSCAWYMPHHGSARFDDLRVRSCGLARVDAWGHKLRTAVESELARARMLRMGYAEVGGWAVAKECRCTSQGLLLALAAYSLGRLLGGTLGLTTATVRHSSSTILRRLGGRYLQTESAAIPSYYDPAYGCQMELLRFDSRQPNPKYASLVEVLAEQLTRVSVIARDERMAPVSRFAFSGAMAPRVLPGELVAVGA